MGEREAGEGDVMEHLGRIEGGDGHQVLLGKPPINILKMGQGGEHHPLMLTMVHQGAETLTVQAVHHGLYLCNPRQHTLFIERADQLAGDQVFLHIEDELTVLFIKGHTTFLSMTRGGKMILIHSTCINIRMRVLVMASYCCVDAGGKVLVRDGDTRTTGGASVFHPDAG